MAVNTMDQGLLKRKPSMTREEFSHHWFTKHAPLVVPFFLHSGMTHYEQARLSSPTTLSTILTHAQIHGPLHSSNPALDVSAWDGAAGMPAQEILDNPAPMPKWKEEYYREVILPDERRFLVSEALQHIIRVPPGSVKGERKVVIRDGKCVVEVGEEVWSVWREYERRGVE